MADRDTLIAALEQTERRLWRNRALGVSMFAVAGVAGMGAVALILEAVMAARRGTTGHGFAITVVVVGAIFAILAFRSLLSSSHFSLERAAAEADSRGGFDDTLKSALWFSRGGEQSAWTTSLIARAAAIARDLDPVEIGRAHV